MSKVPFRRGKDTRKGGGAVKAGRWHEQRTKEKMVGLDVGRMEEGSDYPTLVTLPREEGTVKGGVQKSHEQISRFGLSTHPRWGAKCHQDKEDEK